MGVIPGPMEVWLAHRSLGTLHVRLERQSRTAQRVAEFLRDHPKVEKVYYMGLLSPGDPQYDLYRRQSSSPGAMIAFDVRVFDTREAAIAWLVELGAAPRADPRVRRSQIRD